MTTLTNVAKALLLSSALLALLIPPLVAAQGSSTDAFEATYRVTFENNWTNTTHPNAGFPTTIAHWSPLVGGAHNANVTFWEPGKEASQGIEDMAEEGKVNPLRDTEIGGSSDALNSFSGSRFPASSQDDPVTLGATTTVEITVDKDHPLVTLVSMIAPSPDWFAGVHGESLLDGNGDWVESKVVTLYPYDAGTDSGPNYTSPDADITPHQSIESLQGDPPFSNEPVGTFTFTRINFTDLHLTKSVQPQTGVAPQSQVTYTVVLSNGGDIVANSSMLTDTLPSNVEFASFVEQPGGATGSGGTITWTGDVPLGTPVTFTYVATYTGMDYGTTLTNTAEVAHSSGNSAQDSAAFTVQSGPMLAISKSAPAAVKLNEPVTYTLTVMNSGAATAMNVVVTDTLPISANFVSADKGVTPISDTLEWQMGDLPGSSMMEVSFVVTAGMTTTLVNDSYGARADGGLTVSGSTAVQTEVNSEGVSSKKMIYLPLILKNAQPSDGGDEHSADLDFADILIE